MPNWCQNRVTFTHPNPELIARIKTGFLNSRLFSEFLPCPKELTEHESPNRDEVLAACFMEKYGAPDWYTWQVNNWGCKWDIDGNSGDLEEIMENKIRIHFDTPWSPPIKFFQHLVDLDSDISIQAYYYEPGMCIAGTFDSQNGDNWVDYSEWTPDEVAEKIPEIDKIFSISEMLDLLEQE